MTSDFKRQVFPISEAFFCDAYYYVLSSTSLGGSGLSAGQIGDAIAGKYTFTGTG